MKNTYEVEIDKLLSEKNPEYYSALKNTLTDFQNELIFKGLITDGAFQNYVLLLKEICRNDTLEFDIAYDLTGNLEELGEGIAKIMPSIESSILTQKYMNAQNSKNFIFNQKILKMVNDGQKINRSKFACLIVDVYNYEDFELLLTKLKIFRLIDPKSDFVHTAYIGKPNSE